MKEFGIEFILQDGTTDGYDPLKKGDLKETDDKYIFPVLGTTYEILKKDVKSFEWCDLCPNCGYELYEDGCREYECSNNKN